MRDYMSDEELDILWTSEWVGWDADFISYWDYFDSSTIYVWLTCFYIPV